MGALKIKHARRLGERPSIQLATDGFAQQWLLAKKKKGLTVLEKPLWRPGGSELIEPSRPTASRPFVLPSIIEKNQPGDHR